MDTPTNTRPSPPSRRGVLPWPAPDSYDEAAFMISALVDNRAVVIYPTGKGGVEGPIVYRLHGGPDLLPGSSPPGP